MKLDFFNSWMNVSLHPWTYVFEDALKHKSQIVTFVSITIASLLGLGLSWVIHILTGQSPNEFKGLVSVWIDSTTQPPFLTWSTIIPLGVIVGFYDFQIVLFIFAWLLRGKGSFGTQAYLQSLFYAPLVIIQQTLIVIPKIGFILFLLVAVYSLIPTTNSLKAAHGYSTIKAILTWLLPILLNIIIIYVVTMILISRSHQ
jgi:hypothetical protein